MATGARSGTHVLSVAVETAFNTENSPFTVQSLATWDLEPGLKNQPIENQAVRVELGEQKPGLGITHPDSELTFSTYAAGLSSAAGDGVAATATALTTLIAGCLGGTPAASTGSTVKAASSPTTTSIAETDAANHAANTLVGFAQDDGTIEVRPVAGYSTDTMTLLMALSTAPSEGNVINGGMNIKNVETSLSTIQGQAVGKNTAQNWKFYGSVGNFTLAEAAESEAQTLQFSFKAGSFTRYESLTQTAPTLARPLVNAGGEYLIGKYGSTATSTLDLMRVGIDLGREYTADPAANDSDGICGWVLTNQQTRITLHVRDTESMPSGFTVTSYFGSFNDTDETENDYHILLNFGQRVGGKILSIYIPRCHLVMQPEQVDMDGIMVQKLTFALSQDSSITNKIWIAQH